MTSESPRITVSESPTPIVPPTKMDWCAACNFMIEGKKIKSLAWDEPGYWFEIVNSRLCLHKPDGIYYILNVSVEDILCEDYVIVT